MRLGTAKGRQQQRRQLPIWRPSVNGEVMLSRQKHTEYSTFSWSAKLSRPIDGFASTGLSICSGHSFLLHSSQARCPIFPFNGCSTDRRPTGSIFGHSSSQHCNAFFFGLRSARNFLHWKSAQLCLWKKSSLKSPFRCLITS